MKTFLVTGATGGIGSRIGHRIAAKGDNVILAARSKEKLDRLSLELSNKHGRIFPVYQVDFALSKSVEKLTQELMHDIQAINGMVLIYPRIAKSTDPLPPASLWKNTFEECFIQPLECLRAARSLMVNGGRIVILSGISNVQVFPQLCMSNAIRSAWLAQAKVLAFHYANAGIHVNTVSLGGTLTEKFLEHLQQRQPSDLPAANSGAVYEDIPENIPLGHYGNPEDAAFVIETMLSEFSNHMTGANIICDGGLVRRY